MDRAKYGAFLVALSGMSITLSAQVKPPLLSPATAAQQAEEPVAPTPHAAMVSPFPAVNPKNFTVDTPTTAVVNDFLTAVWGSNENRMWSVAAIQKTQAPGVSRVLVLVADKTQQTNVTQSVFYVMPDGKHAIADTLIDFGAKPFAERKKMLEDKTSGPGEGEAGKSLLLVEFGDLLNTKSKEMHDTAERLAKEFPQIRLVYENAPPAGRPYSFRAAAEGVCLRKVKGDAAFFMYVQTIYDKLTTLTAATAEATFSAAVTEAGGDSKAVSACADGAAAQDDVKASMALGTDAGVEQAPVLVINGHVLPQTSADGYETLKSIVVFQASQDGVVLHVQPTLSTLK